MNSSLAKVFIDDEDTSVHLEAGTWFTKINNPAVQPPVGTSPMYGTVHFVQTDPSTQARIVYEYNGTEFSAHFRTENGESVAASCSLDGQDIFPQKNHSQFICSSNGTVVEGKHQLIVLVSAEYTEFDYLEYQTSTADATAADIVYDGFDQLSKSGDALDFSFLGQALGVYVSWNEGSPDAVPFHLKYAIDDGPALYFTAENPVNYTNPLNEPQLLIQTPHYPLDEHKFHLELLPPTSANQTALNIHSIIVQNSEMTMKRNLTVFPATNQTSPSASPSASGSSISGSTRGPPPVTTGALVGSIFGVIAAVGLPFLILYFVSRRRRSRTQESASKSAFAMCPRSSANDEGLCHVSEKRSSVANSALEDGHDDARGYILSLPQLKRGG